MPLHVNRQCIWLADQFQNFLGTIVFGDMNKEVTWLGKSQPNGLNLQCYLSEEIPFKAKHLNSLIINISNSKCTTFITHSNIPKVSETVLALFLLIQIETQIDTDADQSPEQPRDYQSAAVH